MKNPLLVGVTHQESKTPDRASSRLLSQEQKERFNDRIASRVTSQSLVILEGWNGGFYRSGDVKYDSVVEEIPVLRSIRPTMLGIDPRLTTRRSEKMYLRWLDIAGMVCARVSNPSSVEKMTEIIRTNAHNLGLRRLLTSEEQGLARYVYAMQRKFDRIHLEALRKYASRFDGCFLVAGSTHCLRISLKTDWECLHLMRDEEAKTMYHTYVATYVIPPLVLGHTSK